MRRILAAGLLAVPLLAIPGVSAGGGGCAHGGDYAMEAKGVRVTMAGVCFTPTNLWIQPGQTVTWVNNGQIEHTVTGPGMALNAQLDPGAKYTFKFENVGVFSYMCQFHPGMAGVVVVGNPKAPSSTVPAPEPNAGISGEIEDASVQQPVAAQAPVAPRSSTSAGTIGGVAALSGATLGAIGFTLGRRRRPID